jgi:small ligand-binding sensory domain FIST
MRTAMTDAAAIWTNAQSTRASLEAAIDEVVERVKTELEGRSATFGLVFVSMAFASEFSRVLPLLQEKIALPVLIGCGSNGVIGTDPTGMTRELEDGPAVSLTVASLPSVRAQAFQLAGDRLPDLDGSPDDWVNFVGLDPADRPQIVVLVDPFAPNIVDLLQGLDYAYPGMPKVGGIASGIRPGEHNSGLFLGTMDGDRVTSELVQGGAVGLALMGNIELETIVAQGCRPIGPPFRVADGQRNIILRVEPCAEDYPRDEQAITSPLEALQNLLETLPDADRTLAKYELFIGLVRDEFKLTLNSGDFLIRNLMGVDPRSGAVAIADRVRPGQRVQFHLRDAKASADDLGALLEGTRRDHSGQGEPIGAFLFACLGRGRGLYEAPDFDTRLFHQYCPDTPIGGCFCNGEIGPVGGSTFLHGYTSVFGVCRLDPVR